MDAVVVLDNGKLAKYGSYEELEVQSANLLHAEHVEPKPQLGQHDESKYRSEGETSGTVEDVADPADLQRSNGSWAVYSYYGRAAGTLSLLLLAIFTLTSSVTTNYMSEYSISSHRLRELTCSLAIWINVWTEANERESNQRLGFYLGIYSLLLVLSNCGAAGELW
jgi:ATP-binding cassette subfamily C (CFTR/MRP) protein 1